MGGRLALALVALSLTVFMLGPRAAVEPRWVEPALPDDLASYLEREEGRVPDLRAGEAKSIVWAGQEGIATALSLVYLHGFTADKHEVEPLVTDLARDLGANAYFTRLEGHGRTSAAMGEATAEGWMDDAAEALAIGAAIGERVVFVGTSTGGTLALWAAMRPEAAERMAALVLISPNLGLQDPAAPLLLWPWGGAIARLVVGAERCFEPLSADQALHWTTCHPVGALLPMMALVAEVRSSPPASLRVPTLVVYSRDDRVVDPDATERVMERLADGHARMHVVENSTDPDQHVIAGTIMSPQTTDPIRRTIMAFLAP